MQLDQNPGKYRYKKMEKIGNGAYGKVYKALDT